MTDKEKGQFPEKASTDSGDEAAAAQLWAVYVSEAEKYDKALVESWKSDMDGLLIFAGLQLRLRRSHSTAFGPNITAASGFHNGTPLQRTAGTVFTPSVSSIICNALWFINLGFSLACALTTTLVQHWAREFLHKADMRSAPVIRARIFSYLHYELKRFQMNTVPGAHHYDDIVAVILLIFLAVYAVFTLLPLGYLDCPYHTPLSGAFWRLWKTVEENWPEGSPPLPT
ncbi:hypothetical protein B0H13DRAFT_2355479 [Mycena leptocephala]|nr:hypothetical protein B0H13DRAFT_2355479 [Mycena leptocephala]